MNKVIFPYLDKTMGGSHISGVTLAAALNQKAELSACIIAPSGSLVTGMASSMDVPVIASDIEPKSGAYYVQFFKGIRNFFHMKGMLLPYKDDCILHCNDPSVLVTWGLVARFIGMPVVYHERSIARMVYPKRIFLRIASHVISISDFCSEKLSYLPPEKITKIDNPFKVSRDLNLKKIKAELKAEMAWPEDSVVVGFCGNLWRRKRPDFFVRVAKAAYDLNPNLRFVMYGRPTDFSFDEIENMACSFGLEGKLRLAGFRQPAEKNIASLDALCVVALDEPLGRTPIEALTLGIPYVITLDGGHREVFERWGGGVGLNVSASVEEYRDALFNVLADPEDIVLPVDKRDDVIRSLSPERHVEEVIKVYQRLLAS